VLFVQRGSLRAPRLPPSDGAGPGFVDNAEVINSRAAMIGFFALILLEAVRLRWRCAALVVAALTLRCRQVTNQGILELLGFETGKGIDIGF